MSRDLICQQLEMACFVDWIDSSIKKTRDGWENQANVVFAE